MQVGKMVLFGVLFGCLDPIVTIAAAISYQTPFVSPVDKRKQAELSKMKLATGASDLITLLNAVNMWQKSRRESRHAERVFLEDHFLKRGEDMAGAWVYTIVRQRITITSGIYFPHY